MKSKKLELTNLKLRSFTTTMKIEKGKRLKGGWVSVGAGCTFAPCDPTLSGHQACPENT